MNLVYYPVKRKSGKLLSFFFTTAFCCFGKSKIIYLRLGEMQIHVLLLFFFSLCIFLFVHYSLRKMHNYYYFTVLLLFFQAYAALISIPFFSILFYFSHKEYSVSFDLILNVAQQKLDETYYMLVYGTSFSGLYLFICKCIYEC